MWVILIDGGEEAWDGSDERSRTGVESCPGFAGWSGLFGPCFEGGETGALGNFG